MPLVRNGSDRFDMVYESPTSSQESQSERLRAPPVYKGHVWTTHSDRYNAKYTAEVLPFWLHVGVYMNEHRKRVIRGTTIFFAYTIGFTFHTLEVLPIASNVLFSLALFTLIMLMIQAYRQISLYGLLPKLLQYCRNKEEVGKLLVNAEMETKLHLLNGALTGIMGLLAYLLVLPKWYTLALGIAGTVLHMFSFWPTLVLYRLVCKLLGLAVIEHVARIRSTLHSVVMQRKEKLKLLTDDQSYMLAMFRDANAALTLPMVCIINLCFLLSLIMLLALVTIPSNSPPIIILRAVFTLLIGGGGLLLLLGMTWVAHAYEEYAGDLYHDPDLVRLAEEVFPNNGASYLAIVVNKQVLGFTLFGFVINARLFISTLVSIAMSIMMTIVFAFFSDSNYN